MAEKMKLHCSMCGASQDDVRCLIAGDTACICDKCVSLCSEIVRETEVEDVVSKILAKRQPSTPETDLASLSASKIGSHWVPILLATVACSAVTFAVMALARSYLGREAFWLVGLLLIACALIGLYRWRK